jgi:hypothetical protein
MLRRYRLTVTDPATNGGHAVPFNFQVILTACSQILYRFWPHFKTCLLDNPSKLRAQLLANFVLRNNSHFPFFSDSKKNRQSHVWDDKNSVPLYFIKQYIEEVEEIEIGNITIFLRKAIEEGKFVVVGSTRTRAIKVKR